MKEVSVSVRGLGKRYTIGHQIASNTLRDVLSASIKKVGKSSSKSAEEFWALKDVSFDVYKGEALGIVGSNGAGKSTILKILSRIIEPTEGEVNIEGRVASLLEVGTGFHPELSGRENVYFNGSILGMKKSEIDKRFDEIVAFSEIERFIDTPVKFYSSGMYVRLAFAIAAHLDPEVLIIDEALAVGDINFQQKCIAKMRETAQSGKTVIFVTHSMNIVEEICDRAIYLKDGRLIEVGDTPKVVSKYLGNTTQNLSTSWELDDTYVAPPKSPILPLSLQLVDNQGKDIARTTSYKDGARVVLGVDVPKPSSDMSIGVSIYDEFNNRIFRTALTDNDSSSRVDKGKNMFSVDLPIDTFREGAYIVALDCDIHKKEWVHNPYHTPVRIKFFLRSDDSRPPLWDLEREGITKPLLQWEKM